MIGKIIEMGDIECLEDCEEPNKSGLVILADREQLKGGRNMFGEIVAVVPKAEQDARIAICEIAKSMRLHKNLPASMRMTDWSDLWSDMEDALTNLHSHETQIQTG